ncbi:hypothetical protein [Candidatus Hecatella orcuttiae]|jgi:hypothetical protein|uniref:hypothetical protein n=1 Tax=Candidatus Hecatella orcuttiae TaxID=1935119 RepID=UPI002867CA3D|nr:hypothetical protein [Candidatus Hecatella orcuttiae]
MGTEEKVYKLGGLGKDAGAVLLLLMFAGISYRYKVLPSSGPLAAYFLLLAIMAAALLLFTITRITIAEEGVILHRPLGEIVIRKIGEVKISRGRALRARKKEVSLTIVGEAPDGKKIRKRVARKGELQERWEEFKEDLNCLRIDTAITRERT